MTKHIEVNDPVDCEVLIAADRPLPEGRYARLCGQCRRDTWAHTSACMWCGRDRSAAALRWLGGLTCVAFLLLAALRNWYFSP